VVGLTDTRKGSTFLRGLVGVFASAGAIATLLLGLVLVGIRLQPDTGHEEDISGGIALAYFSLSGCISLCAGLGGGIGSLAFSTTRRGRLASQALIGLTLAGFACGVASWLV
jgi:hypothetical protein